MTEPGELLAPRAAVRAEDDVAAAEELHESARDERRRVGRGRDEPEPLDAQGQDGDVDQRRDGADADAAEGSQEDRTELFHVPSGCNPRTGRLARKTLSGSGPGCANRARL